MGVSRWASRACAIAAVVVCGTVGPAVSPAAAATITFDSYGGTLINGGGTKTFDGFDFGITNVNGGFGFVGLQSSLTNNGTPNLFVANHSILTMTRSGGGAFELSSFDLAGSWISDPSRWAESVTVTGQLDGGGAITLTVPVTGSFVTRAFGSSSLTSVTFTPSNPSGCSSDFEFELDNIQVADAQATPVPEPASMTLLGTGIAAAWAARRRRK
jgi:hypothetical protein